MSFATGSRSGLSYVVETAFGVTPASPAMQDLPITGQRLNVEKNILTSATIQTNRQGNVVRHGQRSVMGTIEADMRRDAFDPFLEAVMMSSFNAGVLDIGTTLRSFTLEDRLSDVALYRKFTGCVVDRLNLRVQPNSLVTLSFHLLGRDQTADMTTALDTVYDPPGATEPFDSYRIVLHEGGNPIAKVSALSLTLENALDPTQIIGANVTPQILLGRVKVSGEMTVYIDDATLLQKFLNETTSALSVQMEDGVKRYTLTVPRLVYTGGSVSLDDDKARLLTLPFEAMYDSTTGTTLRLTKVTL